MSVKVYVEGGGDRRDLKTKCRQGFRIFLETAGLEGRMPRIVASGTRDNAYGDFCTALSNAGEDDFIVLLVDSEESVTPGSGTWAHLNQRDGWDKPPGAVDDNAHLMVQCMEAWLVADKSALSKYYGQGFGENALPKRVDVEDISKQDLYDGLKAATRSTQKGEYSKGGHSFGILSLLDPGLIRSASPHADRLVKVLIAHA